MDLLYTVGLASLYDAGIARSPGRFCKGGRDERGEGGTVFKNSAHAQEVADRSTRATGDTYCVYIVYIPRFTPVSWSSPESGELLISAPITGRARIG